MRLVKVNEQYQALGHCWWLRLVWLALCNCMLTAAPPVFPC
jgi:hypothetical protein